LRFLDFPQWWPSTFWILAYIWTTFEDYLVVFITIQNLVVIDAGVLIIEGLNILHIWLENVYSGFQNEGFGGNLTP